jgi:TonB-linked SusC/RagA family outer membrane protein
MKKLLQKHRTCLFLIKALVLYLGFSTQVIAQQIVQGKVLDEKKEPIIGASVLVKGTNNGTNTSGDGSYKIEVGNNATLEFSYIGFSSKQVLVNGQSSLNVVLQSENKVLDEVVVVSYGNQTKKKVLGSVQVVNNKDLKDVPGAEIGQKLQGRVAGLQINQANGRPGQGMAFRIRGAASLGSGNQPLIVVDGQPITGDLNLISSDDIESFSVLKDASASALYGSRAANGVILIVTKKAKAGSTSISFNTYTGIQTVLERGKPDLMNANEFATFQKGFYEDKIRYENWKYPKTGLAEVPDDYKNPENYGKGTDWYDALLRSAPITNYSLNISTGTEKLLSSNTLTYFKQEGVLVNTEMSRISFRSNNEYNPSKSLKIGFNIAPTYQMDHNTTAGLDALTGRPIIVGAEISSPLVPVVNPDGSYPKPISYGTYPLPNFYEQLKILDLNNNIFRLLGNAFFEVKIIEGLKFKSSYNTDLGFTDSNVFRPSTYGFFGTPGPTIPSATHNSNNYVSWLIENTLTYSKKINSHTFDFLVGHSAQKYDRNYRTINGSNFANDDIPWIVGAATTTGTTNNNAYAIESMFGRVNYDFKGKYLFSASMRRDGSSRFGINKKYGTFPSASVGWLASEESFFPKSDNFSFMKVKAGYGVTGNNNIGDYTQTTTLGPTNYVFSGALVPGLSINNLGNPDLTWETSKQLDIGLEVSLFKSRVSLQYDFYDKRTDGMLYQISIPFSSGYSSIRYNVGEFKMWGHEFQINTKNLIGDLKWDTSMNFSFLDNKVLSLQDNTPIGGVNKYNDFNRTEVGGRIGDLYGYVFDGVYMNQQEFDSQPKHATSAVGTARMKDINGDGKIDGNDRTFLGNSSPKFLYGITNTLSYKNFDFSMTMSGQTGNKIMNVNMQNSQNLDGIFNVERDMMNRWRSPENPGNGQVPRTLSNTTELYRLGNSNWVFAGDYLTIRNISLGYTMHFDSKYLIKSARLYFNANQVYVFTKYPGQNPEVNDTRDNQTTAGQDNGSYPVPRTLSIGTNINF